MTTQTKTTWQKVKIGDLLSDYIGGGWGNDSPTSEFSEPAFVLRGTDIPHVSIGDVESLPFRYHKKSNIKSRKLKEGDIIFEVSGGSKGQWVGRSLIVKDRLLKRLNRDVIPASFCKGLTPNSAKVDSGFLYYFLQKIYRSDEISQWQTQSTGISNFKFEKFLEECLLNLPPLVTQEQIANIFLPYDDLIENNTKRMKILEEIAQAIYKEWFVYFRFPGSAYAKASADRHEKVRMIDSKTEFGKIPEGWEIKKIKDIFDVKYGKNLPTSKIQASGDFPVYGAGGVIGFYNEQNSNGKVALVTCRGNGSGTVWRTRGLGFVTNNSFTVRPKEEYKYINFTTVYFALKNANVDSAISGSAQPQITIESLNFVSVLLPNEGLLKDFQNAVTRLFDLIDSLFVENQNLRQARDLLLPKLINGEVKIS